MEDEAIGLLHLPPTRLPKAVAARSKYSKASLTTLNNPFIAVYIQYPVL